MPAYFEQLKSESKIMKARRYFNMIKFYKLHSSATTYTLRIGESSYNQIFRF
jgi:hypothetical protein